MKRRRKPITPASQIRSTLRGLYMRSRERAEALKLSGRACEECGKKASKAKGKECGLEVHHMEGSIPWEHLIAHIRRHLLCSPEQLEVLCHDCHQARHEDNG